MLCIIGKGCLYPLSSLSLKWFKTFFCLTWRASPTTAISCQDFIVGCKVPPVSSPGEHKRSKGKQQTAPTCWQYKWLQTSVVLAVRLLRSAFLPASQCLYQVLDAPIAHSPRKEQHKKSLQRKDTKGLLMWSKTRAFKADLARIRLCIPHSHLPPLKVLDMQYYSKPQPSFLLKLLPELCWSYYLSLLHVSLPCSFKH